MAKASDNQYPSVLFGEGTTPTSPGAGTQRLFIDSADHKLKRVNSGGTVTTVEGAAAASVKSARFKITSGNLTVNSTTWVDVTTAADMTLAATAGDVIEISMFTRAQAASHSYLVLDFHTMVSGTPTNSVVTGAAPGTTAAFSSAAWARAQVAISTDTTPNSYTYVGGTHQYVVQAGDISAGNVTFRLRGLSGASMTLAASDPALTGNAKNLGQ